MKPLRLRRDGLPIFSRRQRTVLLDGMRTQLSERAVQGDLEAMGLVEQIDDRAARLMERDSQRETPSVPVAKPYRAKDVQRHFDRVRREARKDIVAQATTHCKETRRVLTLKNINEAVAIVRHWETVAPETLLTAGFNPERASH